MDAPVPQMDRGELVPDDVSGRELRAEAGRRAHAAGYDVRRDGGLGPPPAKVQGLCPWGPRKLNVWPRDARGRLIE
jgi:hypothetical protein